MGRGVYLIATLLLSGCGISATSREKNATVDESVPFYVAQFFPASGAELPSTVTVTFNEVPLRSTLAALTHYNINCGGDTHAASAVDATSGFASATVTLPDMGVLEDGTQCTFAVSSSLLDQNGNRLGGGRTAVYTVIED